jgi:hypothetical protein
MGGSCSTPQSPAAASSPFHLNAALFPGQIPPPPPSHRLPPSLRSTSWFFKIWVGGSAPRCRICPGLRTWTKRWVVLGPFPASSQLTRAQAFDGMVKEICNALVEADVNVKLVVGLRTAIKRAVNFKELPPGVNKRRIIQKVDLRPLVF